MTFPEAYRSHLLAAIQSVDLTKVDQAIAWFQEARDQNRTIFICGNGGSASTASHMTADMVKSASYGKEQRFRVMALTDSLPTLTAYSNDVCYECVFEEQLKNFARSGDLVMAISGSGNSPNVLRAIEFAKNAGCRSIALTGRDGGKLGKIADLNIHVSSPHMGRIEDTHMMICHMIIYQFAEN